MQQVVNHRLKLSADGAVLVPLILFCNPSLKKGANHNQGLNKQDLAVDEKLLGSKVRPNIFQFCSRMNKFFRV